MKDERIVDAFIDDGILFEVVEKPQTIFAGKLGYGEGPGGEPDIGELLEGYRRIMALITEAVEPEWWMGLSIDFGKPDIPSGYMFALEVRTEEQPQGVDVHRAPASLYVRIRKDQGVLKLLGKDDCQTFELFSLIFNAMERHGYRHAMEGGAPEIECDYSKDMRIAFAYVAAQRV